MRRATFQGTMRGVEDLGSTRDMADQILGFDVGDIRRVVKEPSIREGRKSCSREDARRITQGYEEDTHRVPLFRVWHVGNIIHFNDRIPRVVNVCQLHSGSIRLRDVVHITWE